MNQLKGDESIKDIRAIIEENECLHGIKSSGKGRTKQVIIEEINEKIASVDQQSDDDDDEKEEEVKSEHEVKEAQQRIQFNITDILLFHQEESMKEIRFLVEYGINRRCQEFNNELFTNKRQIKLFGKSATKKNILRQIKSRWSKLSCDELNNYDTAKRKIYVKHIRSHVGSILSFVYLFT